jgi:ATP-dependent RNA circularization protein (DNA/RNA ligase family)
MLRKYPSTFHLPWSKGITNDDKVLKSISHLSGKPVIITEKMDGENTTIYHGGYCHARSLDSGYHESRTCVKKLAGEIGHLIPDGWRICGENMYAKHSIEYDNLEDFFLVFSVWDENNRCLTWKQTLEFCDKLGLKTVPVLYWGLWNDSTKFHLSVDERKSEGYVVRVDEPFHFSNFSNNVAKYVRKNHVQTNEHWLQQQLVKNKLKEFGHEKKQN